MKLYRIAILLIAGTLALAQTTRPTVQTVRPAYLGAFDKELLSHGVRILGSGAIDDEVFFRVDRTLARLLEHQPNVAKNLEAIGAEIRLVGEDQLFKDVPGAMGNAQEMKRRGVSRFAFANVNVVILPEENVRPRRLRPYPDSRDIASHEISHMLHLGGFSSELSRAISERYEAVKRDGKLWPHAYAMTNDREFFAELTMWYFGSNGDPGKIAPHPQQGAQWLRAYDPDSYDLIDRIYSGKLLAQPIYWTVAKTRDTANLQSGNDPARATLLVKNASATALSIIWLDADGQPHSYGTLAAGETVGQDTFLSHAWKFVDAQEKTAGACVVESGRTIYTVAPTAEGGTR
jgi:hypothetical protein